MAAPLCRLQRARVCSPAHRFAQRSLASELACQRLAWQELAVIDHLDCISRDEGKSSEQIRAYFHTSARPIDWHNLFSVGARQTRDSSLNSRRSGESKTSYAYTTGRLDYLSSYMSVYWQQQQQVAPRLPQTPLRPQLRLQCRSDSPEMGRCEAKSPDLLSRQDTGW